MWTASPVAIPPMSYRKATKGRSRAKGRASNTELCVLHWGQDSGQPRARTEQRDQSPRPGEEFCADKTGQTHQVRHVRGTACGTRGAAVHVVSPPPAPLRKKTGSRQVTTQTTATAAPLPQRPRAPVAHNVRASRAQLNTGLTAPGGSQGAPGAHGQLPAPRETGFPVCACCPTQAAIRGLQAAGHTHGDSCPATEPAGALGSKRSCGRWGAGGPDRRVRAGRATARSRQQGRGKDHLASPAACDPARQTAALSATGAGHLGLSTSRTESTASCLDPKAPSPVATC